VPLDAYRQKRDFRQTPEPAGNARSTAPDSNHRPSFVVHKHAATRLHYDVRLEHDGVLLSWAVPKGPSYDTHDKRLAVHVEDHPLEYGGFEGTIPAGEYGGGTVMVWDRGTYEPLAPFQAGLETGSLKFVLAGEKLRGAWTLVRMRPKPGEKAENWLLIKERDEHVRPREEYDVLDARPESALSGRSMEQIAAGADAGAADRPPAETPVQLATLVDSPPEGEEWLHEVKYDGYRVRAILDNDRARMLTRTGQDWTQRFAPIARAIESLPARSALVEGEVVATDERGVPSFADLQHALSHGESDTLRYMAFDLLHLDGQDLRGMPLEARKNLLRALIGAGPGADGPLRYVDHVRGSGSEFYREACALALEGSISKRADRPYTAGRSRDWLKIKCLQGQEFVVVGWTEPRGSRTGFGALLLGVYEDGRLRYAGRVGTGFTSADLRAIRPRLDELATPTAPFDTPPDLRRVPHHWVEPRMVAEVAFQEWTRDGVIRHPSFKGMREDKPVAEVVAESAPRDPAPPQIRVAGVAITNPDKELQVSQDGAAGTGLSKLDLASYYERIADHIMPHIGGRPLTLVRCPHGSHRDCFYQKHPEDRGLAPDIRTFDVTEHGRAQRYMFVDSLPGLVSLVQMGALELHAWNSLARDPEHPDRVVFDLDPGPGVEWKTTCEAALLVRDALGALELPAFVKTTGGKGLHVVVPIVPTRDHDQVRDFAHALVERLAAHEPGLFTAKMAKSSRPGRIFIDYLRNAHGATAVAAFSTRARPGAPVSVPLAWAELVDDLDPLALDTRTVQVRLERLAVDPWFDYGASRVDVTDAVYAALGIPHQPRL
jgi:bifunctional non-homologous end joining protein LigD